MRLFYITASSKKAVENLKSTIEKDFPIGDYTSRLESSLISELKNEGVDKNVRMWGLRPGTLNTPRWESIKKGDRLLVYTKGEFKYYCEVLAKTNSQELASFAWGHEDEKTWQHIIFIRIIKKIEIKREVFNQFFDYNPKFVPLGFNCVSNDRLTKKIQMFEDIDRVIEYLSETFKEIALTPEVLAMSVAIKPRIKAIGFLKRSFIDSQMLNNEIIVNSQHYSFKPNWLKNLGKQLNIELEDLPFFLVRENDLYSVFYNKSDWNKKLEDTLIVEIPDDTEAIFELDYLNNSDPSMVYPDDMPSGNMEKLYYFKPSDRDSTPNNKVFLFIKKLGRTFRSLFKEFDSKLYEVKLDSKGKLLDAEIKESEILTGSTDEKTIIGLIVHGFSSYTKDNFESLKKALLNSGHYNRVIAYTYPSRKFEISQNGKKLFDKLKETGLFNENHTLDIYAHSQGGLVSRSMIGEHLLNSDEINNIRNLVLAGTPNDGTPIASVGSSLFSGVKPIGVSILASIVQWAFITNNPLVNDFSNFIYQVLAFYKGDKDDKDDSPGLNDMKPESDFIKRINTIDLQINHIYLFGYALPDTETGISRLMRSTINLLGFFNGKLNDGIVPLESAIHKFISTIPIKIIEDKQGWHTWYYSKDENANDIVQSVFSSTGKI